MSSTQEVGDIFGHGKGAAQAMLRSPTVLILCVGLWGMNIFFYRLFGIDYRYVLNYDLLEIEEEEKARQRLDGYTETSTNEKDLENKRTHKRSGSNQSLGSFSSPVSPSKAKPGSHDNLMQTAQSHSSSLSPMELMSQGPPSSILWHKLVLFSVSLLFLLHSATHYWMDHLHRDSIGAVFFFYGTMILYIFLPIQQNAWLRRAFVIVAKRTWALIHPRCSCIRLMGTNVVPRRIPFVDVFYADAMCSLSKVFFDWGMLAHQAAHYPSPVPPATHNILIPSICAALPYLIRARQCLIMHTVGRLQRDPKRYQHLMNAFKYSTSMYPLILSAYLKTFSTEDDTSKLERLLVVLLIINASYSLYWDIVMDWGMMQEPYKVAQTACQISIPATVHFDGSVDENTNEASGRTLKGHNRAAVGPNRESFYNLCLRPRLRFGLTLTTLIVVADSFLRFSWTLKFVPNLFPSNDAFVLCTEFLEVFRRAIWNLLRVEWENIKQTKMNAHSGQPSTKDSLSDTDPRDHRDDEQQDRLFTNDTLGIVAKEDPPGPILEMKILR